MDMNDSIEILKSRASLRTYAKRPLDKSDVDQVIECAMRAPTAGNMMAYSIIAITSDEKKKILSHTCDNQPFIANAPLILIFAADYQKWFDYYNINNVSEFCDRTLRIFTKPSPASLLLAVSDALIASENAVIAGEALGIGSCYIGDIMENYEDHRKLLNLPEFVFPVAMLCMGYYPEGYKKTLHERFDRKYIVFNNEYRRLTYEEIKDMYSGWDVKFNPQNQLKADNFAQMHFAYKTGADFSKEMTRSIKEVLKIWNGEKG
jgi:FMN reductase (NADPH)